MSLLLRPWSPSVPRLGIDRFDSARTAMRSQESDPLLISLGGQTGRSDHGAKRTSYNQYRPFLADPS